MTPSAARLSEKEHKKAVDQEKTARDDNRKQIHENQTFIPNEWIAQRRAEARHLPANERQQYVKKATIRLIDSMLSERCFMVESRHGTQFGKTSDPFLVGGISLIDSVLYCTFARPMYFRSENFDYQEVSKNEKQTEIRVHNTRATELFKSPLQLLIKLTIFANRESELIISSLDGKSVHVHSYGSIRPLNKNVFMRHYDTAFDY